MMPQLGEDITTTYEPYSDPYAQWSVKALYRQKFQVYSQYQIIDFLGTGATGPVTLARDKGIGTPNHEFVAIKKIGTDHFDYQIFGKGIIRELKLLRLLKHQNIVDLKTIMLPKSRAKFHDAYAVLEKMDTDLHSVIRSDQPLNQEHCQFFLYQLLRALKYIHSAKVIHYDLKPRNCLVNEDCDIKIYNFKLPKCFQDMGKVATRWYLAPELLLSMRPFTTSVDIWSVGCIFAEILLRRPFLSGTDAGNQIGLICEFIAVPDLVTIKNIPVDSRRFLQKQMKRHSKDLSEIFGTLTSPQGLDLMRKLLEFDPEKRITAIEALKHPYLADLHLEEDEPSREEISPLELEFENHKLTTQQLKDVLYEEILLYHSKEFKQGYEEKKKKKESLISHILKNSNASKINFDDE